MLLLMLFTLTQSQGWAEEGRVCPGLKSPNDVLQCVRERSPEAKRLEALREAGEREAKAIRRWVNPEVMNQSLFASSSGESRSQIQIGILQPIEFGSRITYKHQATEAVVQRSRSDYQLGLAEVLMRTGRDLIRLEQLRREQSVIRESIETYRKLIRQFGLRPRLSPEQEVSLSVYQLSQSDFLLKDQSAEQEHQEILARLKAQLQIEPNELLALAKVKIQLRDLPSVDLNSSPKAMSLESSVQANEASLSLERADAFSRIAVGPMVQFDSDAGAKTHWFGFQFSLPLPIWNQNGNGVDAAAQKLKAAELDYSVQLRELGEEVKVLTQNYARYRNVLKQIPDLNDLEQKHKKVENQIYRGLVNSALVVESHRSLFEMYRSRHEAELEGITTLWKINQIQGTSEEIHL